MSIAIYFKILQRRNRYRNPDHYLTPPSDFIYTDSEYKDAQIYIQNLEYHKVSYAYPGHDNYPEVFLKMQEPPLFIEYIGKPIWKSAPMISVVGSRDMMQATHVWMRHHLAEFLKHETEVAVVSGGAHGVDQMAHTVAIKEGCSTIFVLPSGLHTMYPSNLEQYRNLSLKSPICFMSEFELTSKAHKSHFYFRNRLIAVLGRITLVTQASLKSGSMLTVHHCLENGRPVVSVPAHPEMSGFQGNIKLLQEGAFMINGFNDLLDFWRAESRSNWT